MRKSSRIATPVTVRVTPVTLTQHRATGRPDPPGIVPDNLLSPIEAGIVNDVLTHIYYSASYLASHNIITLDSDKINN